MFKHQAAGSPRLPCRREQGKLTCALSLPCLYLQRQFLDLVWGERIQEKHSGLHKTSKFWEAEMAVIYHEMPQMKDIFRENFPNFAQGPACILAKTKLLMDKVTPQDLAQAHTRERTNRDVKRKQLWQYMQARETFLF